VEDEDYSLMTYAANGSGTGDLTPVDLQLTTPNTSSSGCEDADFTGFPAGEIALLQRGSCAFGDKVVNAQEAGAVAAVIMNQGDTAAADRQDLFAGTLGAPVDIPAISVSFPTGQELAASTPTATITAQTDSRIADTWNVTAQTRKGNRQNVVMAGAHLDSVPEGNGINDNGSGSAALLETAEALADMKRKPENQVRFAWWGAEELGLLGSEHYVADLAENHPRQFQNIALYLNFDMVGSPNYILGVYDGNGDSFDPPVSTEAPEGSAAIERSFHRFFDRIGTDSVDTAFSGRSDYGPFIALNVPAGGLFTGAEGIKTAEEAALFGGTAGVAYDPNYHQVGDTIGNVNRAALTANLGAIKHAVFKYARSTRSVNGNRTGHEPPPPARTARSHADHHHHQGAVR
jgi:Zn-dependent M28 family amino/carboxypeptidase